jgi:hypothetical protein
VLHIRCGTDIVADLRAGGAPGEILVWHDPLCLGPTPGVDPPAWYDLRSAFIARAFDMDAAQVHGDLAAADARLASAHEHDEVVLWFEHDLYDQSILIRLLAWFADHPAARLSLVTIHSHPEVPRFIGLGNLDARQLMELFARRTEVAPDTLELASEAWDAWRAPDPSGLERLAAREMPGLPYLAAAIRRHLEDLPWIGDGLARTERMILRAAEGGRTGEQIFRTLMDAEEAPWMGDTMCYHLIRELARSDPSLLRTEADLGALAGLRRAVVVPTSEGEAVLAGQDRVALTGLDAWVGGIQLEGRRAAWRWDPAGGAVRRE